MRTMGKLLDLGVSQEKLRKESLQEELSHSPLLPPTLDPERALTCSHQAKKTAGCLLAEILPVPPKSHTAASARSPSQSPLGLA